MTRFYLLLLILFSFVSGCTSIDYSRREASQKSYPMASSKEMPKQIPIKQEATINTNINEQPKVITTAMVSQTPPTQQKKKAPPASRQAVLN